MYIGEDPMNMAGKLFYKLTSIDMCDEDITRRAIRYPMFPLVLLLMLARTDFLPGEGCLLFAANVFQQINMSLGEVCHM